MDHYPQNGHVGFSPFFLIKMECHGDGLPRASGAERIVFLQYNVHGRLSFPINMVMVMVMVDVNRLLALVRVQLFTIKLFLKSK